MRYLLFLIILTPLQLLSQTPITEIRWMNLETAMKAYEKQEKPLLIDIYTDWCGWCKRMDKTTYSNPSIAAYINTYFYPVKLNAEKRDTILLEGKTYAPVRGQKAHPLAVKLLEGKLSYPSTIFWERDANFRLRVPGFLDVKLMEPFLVYFAEKAYKTTPIDQFREDFKTTFETNSRDKTNLIQWLSFEQLDKQRRGSDKKILLYLSAKWNNSSKMMQATTFSDSTIAQLINEKYLPVRLDAQSRDSILFLNGKFVNAGKQNGNFHQLALALGQGKIKLPGLFLFDQQGKLINRTSYFLGNTIAQTLLEYFADDAYLHEKWQDFRNKNTHTNKGANSSK
ncbi:MAG: DUF255 domain-containing protein [Marinifilaceae bacterium]